MLRRHAPGHIFRPGPVWGCDIFGALCYPTNDDEDLGRLNPEADIGIFIGYSPSKKAYRKYNKRTQIIMEKIHISSGLILNSAPSTSNNAPTKKDLDILFQPMSDEYFQPSPSDVSTTISAATLPQDIARETSSTTIDQDAPSPRLQVSQNPRGIFINQSKYALEMLKRYGLKNSDAIDAPMVERSKLDEDQHGTQVDPTRYRSMGFDILEVGELKEGVLFRTMTNTRSGMTPAAIEEMINQRVDAALEARRVNRDLELGNGNDNGGGDGNGNGNGNGTGNGNNGGDNGDGNENRNVNGRGDRPVAHEYGGKIETVFHISNYSERYQVKYATCTLLDSALTWWNFHKRTIRTDVAYTLSWRELLKLMTEVYCPRNEIQKMETEL
ncbi:retrovirus-related pol polyprotein from transposon TNT 1-94 [Tanacetum coccineum]